MISPGLVHVTAAAVALAVGALIFRAPKGTMRHRRFGFLYVGAMVYLNIAAWAVDTKGVIGPFHYLTVVSLATLALAYSSVLLGRRSRVRGETHGILMAWSYAGAVSAALGQGAAAAELPVGIVIGGSLATAGVIIHIGRPAALRLPPNWR